MTLYNKDSKVKAARNLTYQKGATPVVVSQNTAGIVTAARNFKGHNFYTVRFDGQTQDWPALDDFLVAG